MSFLRLVLAAGTPVACYGVYKAVKFLISPYFSPMRDLQGPKSISFIWGNLEEIRKAENSKMHEEWTEKYGKVITYKGFFCVSHLLDYKSAYTCMCNIDDLIGQRYSSAIGCILRTREH